MLHSCLSLLNTKSGIFFSSYYCYRQIPASSPISPLIVYHSKCSCFILLYFYFLYLQKQNMANSEEANKLIALVAFIIKHLSLSLLLLPIFFFLPIFLFQVWYIYTLKCNILYHLFFLTFIGNEKNLSTFC